MSKKGVRWRDIKAELLKDEEFKKEYDDLQSGYEFACKIVEDFIKEHGEIK